METRLEMKKPPPVTSLADGAVSLSKRLLYLVDFTGLKSFLLAQRER